MPGILVVEDDENLNRGITFSLKKSGYEVFSAESVKKAKRIASDNIVFALVIKFACLALGAVGFVNMWWAIFADVGVMILAGLNATRALSFKE